MLHELKCNNKNVCVGCSYFITVVIIIHIARIIRLYICISDLQDILVINLYCSLVGLLCLYHAIAAKLAIS